jgi:hypothetical protein
MRWPQIICPLVALVIAAVVFGVVHSREHSHYYLRAHAEQVARDLIATTNSAKLVAFAPRLRQQLANYLGSPTAIQGVRFGDLPAPAGNGQAAVCVLLTNSNRPLVIRLAPTPSADKFDLLGFAFRMD